MVFDPVKKAIYFIFMGVEWKSYALKVSFLEIVQTLELCGLLCLALREAQKPIWCDLKVVYGCNAFGCFVERYFKLNFLDAELKKLEFRWELYPVTLPQSSLFKVRNYLVWTSFHHSLNLTEISLQTRLYWLSVLMWTWIFHRRKPKEILRLSCAAQLGSPQND